jgi:uncharacterized integral membrane protein
MRREDDPGMSDDVGGRPEKEGLSGKWIAAIVAGVLLLIFAIQNSEKVDVDFWVFDAEVRIVSVIVLSAVLGFVIGWFVGRPSRMQRKAMRKGMD